MLIYGIDPGFTGAITLYWPKTGDIEVHDMPTMMNARGKPILNHHGILSILEPEGDGERVAWVEQVGALHMALAATNTPMRLVTPAKWKGHFGLSRDKGVSRGVAMQRFPEFAEKFKRVKDDGRAEATLIALYGKETM